MLKVDRRRRQVCAKTRLVRDVFDLPLNSSANQRICININISKNAKHHAI